MAEPISLASGILTLITFGLKASTSLYQTIKGYNSHQRNVRELREELEALTSVLESLSQAITDADADFIALRIPLYRCGNACKDFEAIIVKCVERSGDSRTSFRGWARLQYMGEDISGFKNVLGSYKATITIALCNANLHATAVTTSVLNEYQEKIADTMSDLTEHLRKVDDRLQALLAQRIDDTEESKTERQNLRSEHESIQQCMNICTDVAAHIDLVRPQVVSYLSSHDDRQVITTTAEVGVSAQRDTEQVLGRCKDDLTNMLSQLRTRLHDVAQRQNILSHQRTIPADQGDEETRLQEELESIKQSLSICEEAAHKAQPDRTNVFEDITMADDGHQIMVSTFGDLVCARKITAGARSVQWFGQMSDASLQELSQKKGESSLQTELVASVLWNELIHEPFKGNQWIIM